MNLLHMKYAVEIARTNSLNKAAETLYVGQSALSRAIKELETSLGVTLFERSSKGMTLTHDGEIFVYYAKSVLAQVDNIESMFSEGKTDKQRFSASVPREKQGRRDILSRDQFHDGGKKRAFRQLEARHNPICPKL